MPIPRIHVFRFSSTTGKSHFLNGATSTLIDTGGASGTTALVAYVGAAIGYYAPNGSFFDGDICEIIMFTRPITTEERDSIEAYLGKKWAITVS